MASHAARWLLGTLSCVVALAAPRAAFSQTAAEIENEKARIAEQISSAEAQGGPRSPASIVPLTELGELYEAEGQHVLAIAAFEQARQLVRENYGLNTLDQAPLMERVVGIQRALGDGRLAHRLCHLGLQPRDDLR